jgi:hypothetical protein
VHVKGLARQFSVNDDEPTVETGSEIAMVRLLTRRALG